MENLVVRRVGKKGMGVFSNKPFKKGQMILRINTRDRITKKNESKMTNYDWNHVNAWGCKKYYRMKPPEKFINHSCNPNSFDKGGLLYAMKRIKKGDEVTLDYSIGGVEDWKMVCKCGGGNCRKIVRGKFLLLPEKLQKKYRPYLEEWYIEKVLKKGRNIHGSPRKRQK
ncbi:MAG: SET domain-containing protein-lysine N-methyltransferase [Candidatus Aenigmarchaeota archaeon]|nr:SET domain-containing protein-lysine N-methyltransferase [Candidatus Aenigmarchaeota archaeon]